ncbi:MAG: metal ABC transporter ATP-binding protein [Candidatus Aminicenantes bacterium]|nr:metal ABC transporter ATP-binding protein [Candidatus Aminicenantes bacterium]
MGSAAVDSALLVSVENVSFSYGRGLVLEDVTLPIFRGDFLAVLGPNGSGKTTLIKTILGVLKPSRGSVKIMGQPVSAFKAWERIGYVPQKATHFDPLFPASVREVVAMGLLASRRPFHRTTRDEAEEIARILALVGLDKEARSPVGRLSGGQQQRVFIARALLLAPHLLVLDEPTTGVDAGMEEQFYDLLSALNIGRGITIVLVTHDIGIANRHITKVACLGRKLVYHGTHEEFCRSAALRDMIAGGHHLISHRH